MNGTHSPPRSITETAEFKAAVAEAVAAQLETAMAKFVVPPPQNNGGDSSAVQLADRLSIQLAKLTGQGIGQNYVDPELMAQRKRHRESMLALLKDMRERKEDVRWKLVGQIYMRLGQAGFAIINPKFRDAATKREEQTEISTYAEPNLAMRPDSPAASQIWSLFCASIGTNENAEEGIEDVEVTQSGAIIRKGLRPPRDVSMLAGDDSDGVQIVRGDDPEKRKVQIFTGMPAVEMA